MYAKDFNIERWCSFEGFLEEENFHLVVNVILFSEHKLGYFLTNLCITCSAVLIFLNNSKNRDNSKMQMIVRCLWTSRVVNLMRFVFLALKFSYEDQALY